MGGPGDSQRSKQGHAAAAALVMAPVAAPSLHVDPAIVRISPAGGMPCYQPKGPMTTREEVLEEARRQTLFSSNALLFQDAVTALNCTQTTLQLLEHIQ